MCTEVLTVSCPASGQCFVDRRKKMLFRRSFSLSAIGNVQLDVFYAREAVCRTQSAVGNSRFKEEETSADSGATAAAISEMVSGTDQAENMASALLEEHINHFFQWVVLPVLLVVCLIYAFANAPVPAKGQIYRSLAATLCLLVGYAAQCCFVTLWSSHGS